MRLLVIGNSSSEINQAIVMAKKNGARATLSPDPDSALLDLCSGKGADLVLIDVNFNVDEFIDDLASQHISVPVIGFGIEADSEKAAAAIKGGAIEYLPLPPDEVMIAGIIELITAEDKTMVCSSPAMKGVMQMAEKIAPSDANVLITGESGTGKEVMTHYIHSNSKRASKPFISVNCAAIPDNLLESELFGHEKGAFTGAANKRIGKFEEAEGGTLLLDEISEMDIRLQAKLLRAIQEREITRVGGSTPVKLNIRIVATSNRDLKKAVEEGTFREDLLFRLNVITLHLPPLRERKEEIEELVKHFVKKHAEANDLSVPEIKPEVFAKLKTYHWPGNVRELENTIHRAVLICNNSVIDEESILLEQAQATQSAAGAEQGADGDDGSAEGLIGRTIESVEQDMIISTLQHVQGNRTHAARILGISIRTLRNKLKAYQEAGMNVPPAA